MFIFLMVVQALIGAALVGVILIQKSEGGGLGVGGSPAGLMSARGAADFLTRSTAVLATLFVVFAILLAALAVKQGSGESVDTSLQRAAPVDPLGSAAQPGAAPATAPAAPAASSAPADPLAGAAKK
ncbi:MAG: preprotein translocase subunit SecG [Sphingomonadales bacterium]|nr:preprotein translocase subunit SecG [Sphingomonadales bacterium]